MYLNSEVKSGLFKEHSYSKNVKDTGSPESQVALFSHRIKHLTEHLKMHKKDVSTQRGLTNLVGKRRRLLKYLENTDISRYRAIIKELGIRR
jgi:small subunit ribosomal protein S15